MLFNNYYHVNNKKRQESWDFTDGLNHPDVIPFKIDNLHGKVIEQSSPCLKSNRRTDGEHHQKQIYGFLLYTIHGIRTDNKWVMYI